MEGLVNYSSEDEHEESGHQKSAERGSPLPTSLRSSGSSNGGIGDEASARASGTTGTPSARSSGNSREEDYSSRHKSSSGSGGNRMSSSSHYSRSEGGRESRDNRDYRDTKDARYTRGGDYSNNNRYECKATERIRQKDYSYKRERDNHHHESRRDDERNRHVTSSSNYKNRYNNSGRDERSRDDRIRDDRSRYSNSVGSADSSHRHRHHHHHHQRSADERSADSYTRPEKSTSDRHRRSRSRSASCSPTPPAVSATQAYPNKRTNLPRNEASPAENESTGFASPAARPIESSHTATVESNTEKETKPIIALSGNTRNSEALLALPLNNTAPKQPSIIAVASSSASASNCEPPSVIQLPSYYNPSVINPNKYAEQVQKRKLLWGSKKAEDTAAKWGNAQFSQDSDGKVASKFMRLMGIKGSAATTVAAAKEESEQKAPVSSNPDIKSREVMFSNMEQQYEVARQATHTMRGVGLGFSSQSRPF